MKTHIDSEKLRALPVQFNDTGEGILLRRGCTQILVHGNQVAGALRTLFSKAGASPSTRGELLAEFPEQSRPAVEELIEQLVMHRFLIPDSGLGSSDSKVESNVDIFFWHFGESASGIAERLNTHAIAILGVNTISRQLANSLSASGVNNFIVVDDPLLRNLRMFKEDGTLNTQTWPEISDLPREFEEWARNTGADSVHCLVATSDSLAIDEMRRWNAFSLKHGFQFVPVYLHNMIGYVGPFVLPGETPCFECVESRRSSHRFGSKFQNEPFGNGLAEQLVNGFHPSMASVVANIAAFEITRFYSGVLPNSNIGSIIEVNLLATEMITRKALKVPNCAQCSSLITKPSTNFRNDLISSHERTFK